ncbi:MULTISPECIES: hypothetical protein [Burkholderia]|uniref:hypothetical protein n=1 Tax=Burkholderia TaxID=32008 RepID=UPI000A8B9CE8|nr:MULTISPECIES: hypothetical protein [Burkholderia]
MVGATRHNEPWSKTALRGYAGKYPDMQLVAFEQDAADASFLFRVGELNTSRVSAPRANWNGGESIREEPSARPSLGE